MEKSMTVNELFEECKKQIEAGHGEKQVWISRDDEGNSFHQLLYDFTPLTEDNKENFETYYGEYLDKDNDIILG